MKNLTIIGIDIAKNYMQIHGTDDKGKVLLKKRVKRENFLTYMANLPKCLIGIEACSGANYWATELFQLGFTVKMMSPVKVKKYVENNKNDAKDAEACTEAVSRKNMQFVPLRTKAQTDMKSLHRIRRHYIKQRTSLMNMIRGILIENGIFIRKGKKYLIQKVTQIINYEISTISDEIRNEFQILYNILKQLNENIDRHDALLEKLSKEDHHCKRLRTLPGIGPVTSTAIIAKIGNGSEFKKGRDLSAFLGVVPKQHSSGDKQVLGKISKHGDRYLRELLIHGGRSALKAAKRKDKVTGLFIKQDEHSQWMRKLEERIGMNKASVAVANKNARIIIGLLKNETIFKAYLAH